MEVVKKVVDEILTRCKQKGVECSEVLASFFARMTLEVGGSRFSLEKPLTQKDLLFVIDESVQQICQRNAPRTETMKMQVAFDASFASETARTREINTLQDQRLKELSRRVCLYNLQSAGNFEGLSHLYKHIFNYLMAHFATRSLEQNASGLRRMEREVAAALESVFPRIGLQAFLALQLEERKVQLSELASIVTGIRIFNRYMGKGGKDIVVYEEEAVHVASEALPLIEREVEELNDLCLLYQESIVSAELGREEVSPQTISRWKEELIHRRQYLTFLHALQEDVSTAAHKVDLIRDSYVTELTSLELFVSGRSSVPKEHVYPKFDALARMNKELKDEHDTLHARMATLAVLQESRDTFEPTLKLSDREGVAVQAALTLEEPASVTAVEEEYQSAAAIVLIENQDKEEKKEEAEKESESVSGIHIVEKTEKLTVHSTPEFMQLPLEYQGFCVWTVVSRGGLLLPGKPELGVVRWRNHYYVFAHELAMTGFMANPLSFVDRLREMCLRKPELIHLLRVQDQFPGSNIQDMIRISMPDAREVVFGSESTSNVVNAATQTPVHFTERKFVPSYSWNEWELRRRVLRISNLKKCATSSQQTDESTFRRHNTSQVYLPRPQETQTRRDAGTNPKRTVEYLQGLRGQTSGATQKGIVKLTYEV